jgi:hypothetical protein
MNTLQKGRKPLIDYHFKLLELDGNELEEFWESLNLDDLETVIAKIVQACDVLIAQQSKRLATLSQ